MKRSLALILAALMLLSLCACGQTAAPAQTEAPAPVEEPVQAEEPVATEEPAPAEPEEITITDMIGREVTVTPGSYQRVVCIGAGALRMYSYIGDVSLLCGVEDIDNTSLAERPKMFDSVARPYMLAYGESFTALPSCGVGGPQAQTAEAEKILSCNPDIVISEYEDVEKEDALQEQLGVPFSLFNDTRAMTVGEYTKGAGAGTQNMLMINVNWGLGMGIVMDGQVYSGKSGYAGELGHVYGFDNQIICRCGKRGCNETEISGQALQRNLVERIRAGESSILSQRVLESDKPLMLSEIRDAVAREDVLCIDVIEKIGILLGEKTSGLINLFNPELVVVGGELAMTGDYLLDPMRMAVNKHAIHLVSRDTRICRSTLGMDAGIVGACLVARRHFIEAHE